MASVTFDQTQPEPAADYSVLAGEYKDAKEKTLKRFTTAYLIQALHENSGNVTSAAKQSGIERQAFQRLMRRYNITSKDFRN